MIGWKEPAHAAAQRTSAAAPVDNIEKRQGRRWKFPLRPEPGKHQEQQRDRRYQEERDQN
jgi:hypothetical protein